MGSRNGGLPPEGQGLAAQGGPPFRAAKQPCQCAERMLSIIKKCPWQQAYPRRLRSAARRNLRTAALWHGPFQPLIEPHGLNPTDGAIAFGPCTEPSAVASPQ